MTTKFEQKEYTKVIRYGKEGTEGLYLPGDEIIVQEKIDGSNVSVVRYDYDYKVHKFSRTTELTEQGGLYGFVNWADEEVNGLDLLPNVVYYGEWIAKQKVKYPENNKKFFLFDLYDLETQEYLPFDMVLEEADKLNFNVAPVLYRGKFISEEHLHSLVGQTKLGGTIKGEPGGEGIVIKGTRRNKYGRRTFTKMVQKGFGEVKHVSQEERAERLRQAENTPERLFVVDTVTEARVDKILYKLQAEGVLLETLLLKDMGTILQYTSKRVYEDIMEEERDLLPEVYDNKLVTKSVSVVLPNMIKQIISSRD